MNRLARPAVAALCAIGFTAFSLKVLPVPFAWIGSMLAFAGFVVAARAPRPLQFPIVMATPVPLALALCELFLACTRPGAVEKETTPRLTREDSLLGWVLVPSQVSSAIAKVGGSVIWNASYTTDPSGHRVAPPNRGEQIEGCLVFFADSFAFGEGVGDHETFPYQVGLATHGRFRVVNLAAPGYGAEQMLAMIERGGLATELPCEPSHIFYSALPHHVFRAAGKTPYSRLGPRYELGADGIPEYVGTTPISSEPRGFHQRLADQLAKSRIQRAWVARQPRSTEADVELYFAIVREAFRRFATQWPEAELHVIGWDLHDLYSNGRARFHDGLATIAAHVHFVDDMLPGYSQDPARYGLHAADEHPSPRAHRMLAAYLAEQLLPPGDS